MKFDITLYAELLIYTGYAWRNMTESEKEILEPGRVLAEYPENPAAGDVVVAVDWKNKKAKIRVRDLFSGKTDVRQYLEVGYHDYDQDLDDLNDAIMKETGVTLIKKREGKY